MCYLVLFQTLLGDDQYVFTRLNKVLDAMPSSDTLIHKLFPRPPSPFDGKLVSSLSLDRTVGVWASISQCLGSSLS